MVHDETRTQLLRKTELKLWRAALTALVIFDGVTYYALRQWYLTWWG